MKEECTYDVEYCSQKKFSFRRKTITKHGEMRNLAAVLYIITAHVFSRISNLIDFYKLT